ncbi:MAG TPA: hypothetical protein VGV38_18280 [Pyrinomonadaceae bacterium]|nr:hypothetical protein [Pyrinomonadaceae bacterium]
MKPAPEQPPAQTPPALDSRERVRRVRARLRRLNRRRNLLQRKATRNQ